MADDKVFLRIPIQGHKPGEGEQTVGPIDLARPKDFKLVRKTRESGGGAISFRPAADLDFASIFSGVQQHLDYSKLISTINELFNQIEISLNQYGDSGQKVWDVAKKIQTFSTILEKMENGMIDEANNILTTMLYALMSDLCNLASYLQEKEKDTASKDAAYMVLESADGLHQDLYLNWAVNIQKLIGAVSVILEIEAVINPVMEKIHEFRSKYDSLKRNNHALIQQAQEKLDGTGSSFNFLAFAFTKFGSKDQEVDIAAETAEAKKIIIQCRQLEEESRQVWINLRQEIVENILTGQDSLISSAKDLIDAIHKIYEIKKSLPLGSPPPYEIYELINRTEYIQSEKILNDPDWLPSRIENRINGELMVLHQFTNSETEPKLTDKMSEILLKSEEMIAEVEHKLSGRSSAITHVARGVKPSLDLLGQIDQTRLQELYEMVICVGLEMTCNHSFYTASTIKSMLGLVRWLDRCTDEECSLYGDALVDLSRRPEELFSIDDRRQVHSMWKSSQTTWVEYIKGRPLPYKYYTKLAYLSIQKAEEFLKKHRLTRGSIRLAYNQRKVAREDEYKSRNNRPRDMLNETEE